MTEEPSKTLVSADYYRIYILARIGVEYTSIRLERVGKARLFSGIPIS